jgi:hypothetical protein
MWPLVPYCRRRGSSISCSRRAASPVVDLPPASATRASLRSGRCARRVAPVVVRRRRGPWSGAESAQDGASRSCARGLPLPTPGLPSRSSMRGRSAASAASRPLPPASWPTRSHVRRRTSSRISRLISCASSSGRVIPHRRWRRSSPRGGSSRAGRSCVGHARRVGRPPWGSPSAEGTFVTSSPRTKSRRSVSPSSTMSTRRGRP